MKQYFKKVNLNITKNSWIVFASLLVLSVACNTHSEKKDENLDNLSEEVNDVKEEFSEIILTEKNELISEVDSVITEFDNQIAKLETEIKKGEKKLNSEAEKMLKDLKAKRDKLSIKINEIEKQTEESWESFRNEVKHDTKQFTSSVRDFFVDNK